MSHQTKKQNSHFWVLVGDVSGCQGISLRWTSQRTTWTWRRLMLLARPKRLRPGSLIMANHPLANGNNSHVHQPPALTMIHLTSLIWHPLRWDVHQCKISFLCLDSQVPAVVFDPRINIHGPANKAKYPGSRRSPTSVGASSWLSRRLTLWSAFAMRSGSWRCVHSRRCMFHTCTLWIDMNWCLLPEDPSNKSKRWVVVCFP